MAGSSLWAVAPCGLTLEASDRGGASLLSHLWRKGEGPKGPLRGLAGHSPGGCVASSCFCVKVNVLGLSVGSAGTAWRRVGLS